MVDNLGDLLSALQDAAHHDNTEVQLAVGDYILPASFEVKTSLRIVGSDKMQTRIICESADHVILFSGPGTFEAENITFEHSGTTGASVIVIRGGQIKFRNCSFVGGIHSNANGSEGVGLLIGGSTTGSVEACDACDHQGEGIIVVESANIMLDSNLCNQNASGIAICDQAITRVLNNEASGNRSFGIVTENEAYVELKGNTARANEIGIAFRNQARGDAIRNRCQRNSVGIHISGNARPVITGNVCNGNEFGLQVQNTGGGDIRLNEFSANTRSGIMMGDSTDAHIEANICQDNTAFGIVFQSRSKGKATSNQCQRNMLGILVMGASSPTLESNFCVDNTTAGIVFHDTTLGIARGNVCRNNQVHGIEVAGHAQPNLVQNSCLYNGEAGIHYYGQAVGSAKKNNCYGNGIRDIVVDGQASPALWGNTALEPKTDVSISPDTLWEYREWVYDLTDQDLSARLLGRVTREGLKLEWWLKMQQFVQTQLSQELRDGWEPVTGIGPDCLEIIETKHTDYLFGGSNGSKFEVYIYLRQARAQLRRQARTVDE